MRADSNMNIVESLLIQNKKCEIESCQNRAACRYNSKWLCGEHVEKIEKELKERKERAAMEIFEKL